jgi:hypothetical protein
MLSGCWQLGRHHDFWTAGADVSVFRPGRSGGRPDSPARRRLGANAARLLEIALLILGLGMLVPGGAVAQGEIQYNSSKCASNPHGMIYVAASHHVFHQPFQNLGYVHGLSPETLAGLPIAPRPFEPKGCPDNPMRGSGFKFSSFSDVANPAMADAAIGGSVQIIDIDPSSWWDTYELYSLSTGNSCGAIAEGKTEIAPGLIACRSPAAASADRPKHSRFVVIVDPRHYTGPLGQSLAIYCAADLRSEVDDHSCEMSYRLTQDLGIWYDFRTSLLPLSRLVSFDQELRRRISEAEVADYRWPVLPTSSPALPIGEKRP